MSATAVFYRSTDPGAPQLTGQRGSLTALLDAVLVDGYGVGQTAKPGAGWTREFAAPNKRAYRNNFLDGSGTYLAVNDGLDDARVGLIKAFEVMTSVDVGSGQSPAVTERPNGIAWYKSSTADATSRTWEAIATSRALYLFVTAHTVSPSSRWFGIATVPMFAGDLESHLPGDQTAFMVACTNSAEFQEYIYAFMAPTTFWYSDVPTNSGCFILRDYQQGSAVRAAACAPSHGRTQYAWGAFGAEFPDPVSGGLLIERPLIYEGINRIRGKMPGVYLPLQVRPFADGAIVEDVAVLPGVTLRAKLFNCFIGPGLDSYDSYGGELLFDMTNPW